MLKILNKVYDKLKLEAKKSVNQKDSNLIVEFIRTFAEIFYH